MTNTRSQLTASPAEIAIGDKVYLMSPLTDRDIAELDEWVRAQFIDSARRSIPSDSPASLWERIMTLAMRESLELSWDRPPGSGLFATVRGIARLFWQGVKKNQPEVTIDQLQADLFNPDNLQMVKLAFANVNRLPDGAEAERNRVSSRPFVRKKPTRASPQGMATPTVK